MNVSKLLCSSPAPGDGLRYGEHSAIAMSRYYRRQKVHHRPVVVWNITRRCNLRCEHCYVAATEHASPKELTHQEALEVIEDLAEFEAPAVLFSGGEPLMREDVPELMGVARQSGLEPVLSSNGTLLTDDVVETLRRAGVRRVGISVDGTEATHDVFRGVDGSFKRTIEGISRCQDAGFTVSLRFTIARHNAQELGGVFELVEQERIPRFCIYHMAYAGRGRRMLSNDLTTEERRDTVTRILERTVDLHRRGIKTEVLTVANHADGPYLLLWAKDHVPERVPEIYRLLQANGGNSSGRGLACIDERGLVHPDQFWRTQKLGNVRERPFSEIWSDEDNELLRQLRDRKALLPERCRNCRFLSTCNGNLRGRAQDATGDVWGDDPGCYLTDEEICVAAGALA